MRLLTAIIMLALAGCTLAPNPVSAGGPSFDGNALNSGVVGRLPNGSYEITPAKLAAYNALISAGYGKGIIPEIKENAGATQLPNGNYVMDDQHIVDFAVMASQYRSGTKP